MLATYVWQLRKAIGPIIETRAPGYVISVSPDRLDTSRFDALLARAQTEPAAEAAATLREALELWRGPALADVTFGSSARDDVTRLNDLRLSALAQRIDHDLALGRHEEVLAELQALVAAHPFRERYRVQLMLALYRAGRQADALETYRDARRRFVDELGIEPGPELQRLEHAVLAHDPELDAPPAVRARAPDAAVENLAPDDRASGLGARPVRLFERERELQMLDRAIERAAGGARGCCSWRVRPGSASPGSWPRRADGRPKAGCSRCRPAAASWSETSRSGSSASSTSRASRTRRCASASSRAPPAPPPRSSACRACRWRRSPRVNGRSPRSTVCTG